MESKKIVLLAACILICEAAGILGSFFTTPSIPTWYASLQKPALAPPNWVFAPVWTSLFFLMGVSLYLVIYRGKGLGKVKPQLTVFGLQLMLNFLWSVLFFGMQNPALAFAEIVILWISIALTIFVFRKVSKASAYLLVPYIMWVSVAALLNFQIWMLNYF